PPPTTNALTSHQRSHLRRSTQKLGRLLGSTPALIEESDEMPETLPLNLQRLAVPLHIQLSSTYTDEDDLARYSSSFSRSSSESSSSDDSMYSTSRRTKSVHVHNTCEQPYLRIAPSTSVHHPHPHASPAYSPPAHTSYTLRPVAPTHRTSAPPPPTHRSPQRTDAFTPQSESTMRRQKMDRLRRTLGDGVPLGVVFPQEGPRSDSRTQQRSRW
ncbi:hypothetical protein B0H10DRAFT_2141785, partial [Mycena sp. CBHHK59/15]